MARKVTCKEFANYLSKIAPNMRSNLEKSIKLCCQKVTDDIKESMAKTPRDMEKSYFTNNKKIAHHPSLPGNPPVVDTGNLRNSIRFEMYDKSKAVYGIVGSTQKEPPYGVYLEYGTSKGGWGGKGMKPRPWLRPAMEKNSEWIRQVIAQAVKNSLKGN